MRSARYNNSSSYQYCSFYSDVPSPLFYCLLVSNSTAFIIPTKVSPPCPSSVFSLLESQCTFEMLNLFLSLCRLPYMPYRDGSRGALLTSTSSTTIDGGQLSRTRHLTVKRYQGAQPKRYHVLTISSDRQTTWKELEGRSRSFCGMSQAFGPFVGVLSELQVSRPKNYYHLDTVTACGVAGQ